MSIVAVTLTEVKLIWLMCAKSSNPEDDGLCHLQKFQMSKFSMILVNLKTQSRSNLPHTIKDLVIMHLGYKYHSQMVYLSIPFVIMRKLNFGL